MIEMIQIHSLFLRKQQHQSSRCIRISLMEVFNDIAGVVEFTVIGVILFQVLIPVFPFNAILEVAVWFLGV